MYFVVIVALQGNHIFSSLIGAAIAGMCETVSSEEIM
jgi:hypothetical protein